MGCESSKKYQIVIFVGSIRKKSVHSGIVNQIQNTIIDRDLMLTLHIPSIQKIPLYSQDYEKQKNIPKEVRKLIQLTQKAQAILIVTPQMNGSLSPLILNVLVWLSRPMMEKKSPLQNKKAGILSASYLSQNHIIDCIQIGKQIKMNFYSDPFHLYLGNKVVDNEGVLISAYEKGRLAEWYKQFIKFLREKKENKNK